MRKLMLMLAACVLAGQVEAQQTELKFATYVNREHRIDKLIIAPMEEAYEGLVGGASKIVVYAQNSLVEGAAGQYQGVIDGVSDFTFALPAYTPDHFPRTLMFELPGVFSDPITVTEALWENLATVEPDFDGLKIVALWGTDPTVLITRDKPVTNVGDIRGMKIRVSSPAHARIIRAWGAEPVTIGSPVAMHDALGNGDIDAIFIAASAVQGFKLYEVGHFLTSNLPASVGTMYIAMNKARYDGLSQAERDVIDGFSGREVSMKAAQAYVEATPRALQAARDNGVQIIELTPFQIQAFEERFPYSQIRIGN